MKKRIVSIFMMLAMCLVVNGSTSTAKTTSITSTEAAINAILDGICQKGILCEKTRYKKGITTMWFATKKSLDKVTKVVYDNVVLKTKSNKAVVKEYKKMLKDIDKLIKKASDKQNKAYLKKLKKGFIKRIGKKPNGWSVKLTGKGNSNSTLIFYFKNGSTKTFTIEMGNIGN